MNIDELLFYTNKKFEEETSDGIYYYQVYEALITLKDIMSHGNCNDCRDERDCTIVPKYGESVRWNCAFYKKKGSDAE